MIRRLLFTAAIAAATSGCAYQPRFEIGTGVRRVNGEEAWVACGRLIQQVNEHAHGEWEHCSDPSSGKPFNDRPDISADHVNVFWGWGGGRR